MSLALVFLWPAMTSGDSKDTVPVLFGLCCDDMEAVRRDVISWWAWPKSQTLNVKLFPGPVTSTFPLFRSPCPGSLEVWPYLSKYWVTHGGALDPYIGNHHYSKLVPMLAQTWLP